MKAMLSRQIGGPDTLVLEELPDPAPAAGEVVIAVKACGVNYPDLLIIEDRYQYKPRAAVRAGRRGGRHRRGGRQRRDRAEGRRPRDRLDHLGRHGREAGAQGRRAASPFRQHADGRGRGALILTYGTSIHALKDRAKLQKGETLLVLGAAGGVGLSAVELGKAMGARVIAAASSEEKVALAKKHGADDGVVYPAGPFDKAGSKALADLFKKACGETGANVIYDPVGGDYSEAALRAIAWEGRFLVVGFPAGIAKLPLNLTLLKSCQVVGVFWGAFTRRDPAGNAANIARADAALCRRRDPAAGVGALSAGAGGRSDRQAGGAAGDGQDRRDDGVRHARCSHAGGGSATRPCRTAGSSMASAISTATAATPRCLPSLARELPADAVWLTSNLVRTRQTAAAILAAAADGRHGAIEPLAVPDLAEQHLGEWQGLERRAFYASAQDRHAYFVVRGRRRAPAGRGELRRSVRSRVSRPSSARTASTAGATSSPSRTVVR